MERIAELLGLLPKSGACVALVGKDEGKAGMTLFSCFEKRLGADTILDVCWVHDDLEQEPERVGENMTFTPV